MLKRLLDRLSGKSTSAGTASPPPPRDTAAPANPANPANPAAQADDPARSITVYDKFGRELQISLAEWREKVLGPNLQAHWDDPQGLYDLIISALGDGLFADVEPASRRLLEIDPMVERGHVMRGIVLLNLARLDEARAVLEAGMARVGRTATLLTNLAKVEFEEGHAADSRATLEAAVRTDPNLDNGLLWWLAQRREEGGEPGYLRALEEASALPGAWRPQLWLARRRLEEGRVEDAVARYREVLQGGAVAADALMMISGDLGNHGHEALLIDLVRPVYDPRRHGPQAGFNLLEAMLRQGRLDEGEALLGALHALDMAPLRQHLDAFADRLLKLRRDTVAEERVDARELEVVALPLDRPVWAMGLGDPRWLLAAKPGDARRVLFLPLGLAGRAPVGGDEALAQREDDAGRLSRAVPLYLAEAVHEWTAHAARLHQPVVMGGGPVVMPGEPDTAALCAAFADSADWLVTGTVAAAGAGRWRLRLQLHECAGGGLLDSAGAEIGDDDAVALRGLETWLLQHLGGGRAQAADAIYRRLPEAALSPYLACLGQGLMLSLAHNEIVPRGALWGERRMIEYPLMMALHWPGHPQLELFFLSGLAKAAGYGSALPPEFASRALQLLQDLEAAGSPLARLAPLAWKALGMADRLAALGPGTEADPVYREWLAELR